MDVDTSHPSFLKVPKESRRLIYTTSTVYIIAASSKGIWNKPYYPVGQSARKVLYLVTMELSAADFAVDPQSAGHTLRRQVSALTRLSKHLYNVIDTSFPANLPVGENDISWLRCDHLAILFEL